MIEKLQALGLTDGESKAYLALLRIGPATVGPLTKNTGVSYSKIYEVLQRLCEKGLASYIVREKTKYFQAVPPDHLTEFLEKQKESIKQKEQDLKAMLPELRAAFKSREQTEAQIFVGIRGLKTAYKQLFEDVTEDDEPIFLYIHKSKYAKQSDKLYLSLTPFYEKLPIPARGVCSVKYKSSPVVKQKTSGMKFRFVKFPISGNIDIYQDKVLQIAWSDKPIGILIKSQDIADSYREYFEEIWAVGQK